MQPDSISGQHCWHQKVRIAKPGPDDKYGDVFVDTNKAHEVYKKWLLKTRPAPGPDNLRRPLWLPRSYKPAAEAYYLTRRMKGESGTGSEIDHKEHKGRKEISRGNPR